MADRVQAYNQHSVPWMGSHPDNTAEGHPGDLDRRPHRAATSPASSTTSSLMNPYLTQAPYPPPSLYPGNRPPQTVHRSDIYFSPNMNYTRYDPLYPTSYPAQHPQQQQPHYPQAPNAAQFYPPHQQQFYGRNHQQHQDYARTPSPQPPLPVPPKPPALQQETGQDGRHAYNHAPLHPGMYRSFTSPPPVLAKPSLLFEPEPSAIPTSAYLGSSSSVQRGPAAAATVPPIPPLPPGVYSAGPSTGEASTSRAEQGQEEDDGDELAVALALSKDESMREEERMKELARLEEEEFERALAASMLSSHRGYEFYDSQPGAGPSNWASSITQSSSPSAIPTDLLQEAGPLSSPPPSSSPKGTPKDVPPVVPSPQVPESADELKADEIVSQAQEAEAASEPVSPPSPQSSKRRSLDTPTPDATASPNIQDILPTYSPELGDSNRTPTTSTFPSTSTQPPSEAPKEEASKEEDDDDDDALPYLRGTRESLSVSIPPSEETRRSRLSPVSASWMDLSYDDSYIDEDEALARRLAEEEAQAAQQESQQSQQSSRTSADSHPFSQSTTSPTSTPIDGESSLPTYNDVISDPGPASRRSTLVPDVRVDSPVTPARDEKAELSRNRSINSVASDPIASTSTQPAVPFPSDGPQAVTALQLEEPQRVIGRVVSMSALPPVRPPLEDDPPLTPLDDLATPGTPSNHQSLGTKGVHLTVTSSSANGMNGAAGSSSVGVLNANHFVDAELLHGVSIDFTPPVISARLAPMQTPMPTLISLPYGRCPPLHFQAPSWRHMLKLMARLSGTKMEPSIEAMAVTKNEALKLRTVIQFLKPHHMSQEWRTILWFTIDHPVPSGIPNANKYHPSSVNTLPFSYTLSNIPAVLRDASDTVLSKTYTIPATAAVPYPSLPITFPNLALYLQAALDDSRKQSSESNPLRKLAKMVQTCYPNDLVVNSTDEPDKPTSGVSGLFKKVMGRGGKKGKKGGGGGNEDTYDLVTPFVPDEWG